MTIRVTGGVSGQVILTLASYAGAS